MATPVTITGANFQTIVVESNLIVMVDFWAQWCPPCKMISPFIEQIADEFEGVAVVGKVNVDENPDIAQKFGIRSIPTILFFKGGEVKDTIIGALPKDQIIAKLNANI
jgi:thioredoxin 1